MAPSHYIPLPRCSDCGAPDCGGIWMRERVGLLARLPLLRRFAPWSDYRPCCSACGFGSLAAPARAVLIPFEAVLTKSQLDRLES